MKRFFRSVIFPMVFLSIAACSSFDAIQTEVPMVPDSSFSLTSSAFQEGGSIPSKYSCRGEEVSPDLVWSGQPNGTASLALAVVDPDARGFVHWVVWNIPPETEGISEDSLPAGAVEGTNNFRRVGWAGPCPPSGSHRYVFTLYALDKAVDLAEGSNLTNLQDAMSGHILAQAQLTGVFP